ncbi:MAG: hypothetical protein JEZ07_08810 [Phycisphaerae bacterium]|nr:hypothetical protein [Phycisphaerae bacterium]
MKIKKLNIEDIRIDGGTQPRVEIDGDVVAEYVELLENKVQLPSITVFYDGVCYWLADGFHRYWANMKIGNGQIEAEVAQGTQRDAVLYSVGANASHGLRRTNQDKAKAVEILLKDDQWLQWSNYEIARRCGVSHVMVSKHRNSLLTVNSERPNARTFVNKNGKTTTMDTTNIGKSNNRKKYGGISDDAFEPVRQCSQLKKRAAVELPYEANYAANAIISAMGEELAFEIAEAIVSKLKGNN